MVGEYLQWIMTRRMSFIQACTAIMHQIRSFAVRACLLELSKKCGGLYLAPEEVDCHR